MAFIGYLLPSRFVQRREISVTIELTLYEGDVDAIGAGQDLMINLAPPRDEDFVPLRHPQGLIDRVGDIDSSSSESGLASYYDQTPARKRFANGFKGLSPQDQPMPHCQFLEVPQISWKSPREAIAFPDHLILGHSHNDRDLHTAMGALMPG